MRINWLAALTTLCICGLAVAQDRGGDCPTGEIPDCNGNCAPESWVGDGICDDGAYEWKGNPIYFNCDDFGCDGGDCDCDGGDDLGACCVGTECHELTEKHCVSEGGKWFGTGSSCNDVDCDGGGGDCPTGEIPDCNGNCAPKSWVGDGICDDGAYEWKGNPIYFNCDDFGCDGGDCDCDCPDINGDGEVGVDEILAVIAAWDTDDADADVNDDGIVDTNDILAVLSAWGPCP